MAASAQRLAERRLAALAASKAELVENSIIGSGGKCGGSGVMKYAKWRKSGERKWRQQAKRRIENENGVAK